MKKIEKFTNKKLLIFVASFVLLLATLFGVLFGTHMNVHAETTLVDREYGMIRYNEATITDDGPLINQCDVFNCKSQIPDLLDLIKAGYRYVTVSIEFQMKEIDDGDQDVYLYKSERADDADCVDHIMFSYFSGVNTNYGWVYVYFKSIPLIRFLDDDFNMGLVIRYDGHGKNEDTWRNKDCIINVTLSQASKRTASTVGGATFLG